MSGLFYKNNVFDIYKQRLFNFLFIIKMRIL
jgi:hypothetical protein